MSTEDLLDCRAVDLARWLAEGRVEPREVVEACIRRIEAKEPEVRAFAFFDAAWLERQLEELEFERRMGRPKGPLFGLPVAVKDIFDTRDMPTENGTRLHAGRRPLQDSAVVERLRAAQALIVGKTVTTELATLTPGPTRNPRDPSRTPGGSSSGSAAAVAAGMVPLAVGSQTNGSVIRPAAFCGIYGMKPSFGLVSRRGCLVQSFLLDHVGTFARHLEDLALLTEVLAGYDPADRATSLRGPLRLYETCTASPPVAPRLAFVPGPGWPRAAETTREGLREIAEVLGERLVAVEIPSPFDRIVEAHRTIWTADMAWHFRREYAAGPGGLSDGLRAMIEEGQRVTAFRYHEARAIRETCSRQLAELFTEFDAILTLATLGEAPDLSTTGDPICCTPWTFLGLPAVTLPLLEGPSGLPVGVQLVGALGDDARLLRTARWLETTLSNHA
ncbi:Putative amidase AmiD [bacterium HR40]|nr:Putative amidase AmiD [bacterium HR40]